MLEDIAQCSAPIIPAREIIPFSSQITIFFSPSSYSFPSSALNFSPFFENLIDISPLIYQDHTHASVDLNQY